MIDQDPALLPFVEALRAQTQAELQDEPVVMAPTAPLVLVTRADPALAVFAQALREQTLQRIEHPARNERQQRPKPQQVPLWRVVAPFSGRSAAAMAMVAAVTLIALNLEGLSRFGKQIKEQGAALAARLSESSESPSIIVARRKGSETGRISRPAAQSPTAPPTLENPKSAVSPSLPSEEVDSPQAATSAEPERLAVPPIKRRRSMTDAQKLALAQRLWKKGQLKRAQTLLRQVAYRSLNRTTAESAFADLFVVGRQRGGRSALTGEWKRYLRRFPKGRYAQDALAGQCLALSSPKQAAPCWARYLQSFPNGSYAQKAKRFQQ